MKSLSTKTQNRSNDIFIKLPITWARRRDIPLTTRVIIGYIYTRSNIKKTDGTLWTISGADIAYNTGISKQAVYPVIKALEATGILTYSHIIPGDTRPVKIYTISKQKLKHYMKDSPPNGLSRPPEIVHQVDLVSPPNGPEIVRQANIEEDKNIEEDDLEEDIEKFVVNNLDISQPGVSQPPDSVSSQPGVSQQSGVSSQPVEQTHAVPEYVVGTSQSRLGDVQPPRPIKYSPPPDRNDKEAFVRWLEETPTGVGPRTNEEWKEYKKRQKDEMWMRL